MDARYVVACVVAFEGSFKQPRAIVLDEGATVTVRVESAGEGLMVVDGIAEADLRVGDQIVMAISPHVTRFVRLYDRRQVYESLMERLQPRKVIKPNDGC